MALINPLLGSNLVTDAAPFDTTLIGNSVWLDGSADLFTKSSFAGHASKKVISVWVQRTGFSAFGLIRGTNSSSDRVGFGDNVLDNQLYLVVNGNNLYSNQSFRDTGWYHYLVSFDLTQSTASNKVKVYINSVDIDTAGGWQVDERSSMSSFGSFNSASVAQQIGRDGASGMYLNAYLAQYCELDGQSIQSGDVATTDFYDTFAFGTNGSQIVPKADADIAALATTAGSNSFCLDFANSSDLGNDISSNNHDFTATSMSSANQSVSTPSKTYSVFNPNAKRSSAFTLSNGNRTAVTPTFDQWMKTTVPFVMSGSNIIRTQFTFSTLGDGLCGITGSPHTTGTYYTNTAAGRGEVALLGNGALTVDGSFNNTYTSALSNGDVVDVIVNLDVGAVYFAVNGTLLNSATQSEIEAGTTTNAAQVGGSFVRRVAGEVFNYYVGQYNPSAATIVYNSGQTAFTHSYSSITSLISLNTADLTAPGNQGTPIDRDWET